MKNKKKAARETGTLTDGKVSTQPIGAMFILPQKEECVNCAETLRSARMGRQKMLFLRKRTALGSRNVE